MRRLLLSFIIIASVLGAYAQPEAGTFSIIPRFGVALSNISNNELGFDTGASSNMPLQKGKYREGVLGGVDFQYQASDLFAVSAGVFYARQGCKFDDTDLAGYAPGNYTAYSDCKTNLDYINIPVMGHEYLFEGFSVNAGLQFGFLASKKQHMVMQDVTINKDGSYTYADQTNQLNNKNLSLHTFDLSIPVGISYEYANVVLDFRYNIGLTKIYKFDSDNCRNKVFAFSIGYKFNL